MSAYVRTNVQPFAHLEKTDLPRLPVPSLLETMRRYREMLIPLANADEMSRLDQQVEEFVHGEGIALQEELEELALTSQSSWLEGFWESLAYLEPRCPVPINVSPGFLMRKDEGTAAVSQLEQAANMIHASILLYCEVAANKMGALKHAKLCMTQFGRLFSTTRIPRIGRDEVRTALGSQHIVVVCSGHFFAIQVMEGQGNVVLPRASILQSLHEVKRLAANRSPASNVGVLTTLDRDSWAHARQELTQISAVNAASLAKIDSAIIICCLDESAPLTSLEASKVMLANREGLNRWFDKNQLVVFSDGRAGVCMEHSVIDGSTLLAYLDYMYDYSSLSLKEELYSQDGKGAVTLLEFNLNSNLRDAITQG